MKRFIVLGVVSLFVLWAGLALAADEETIQDLQTDVSVTRNKADTNALKIKNLKGGLPAEKAEREEADRNLQNAINALSEQINTCCNQPTPPTIEHNAPDSTTDIPVDITFNVKDDTELAFYAVQSTVSPYINMTSYLGPGISSTSFTITIDLHPGQPGDPPGFNDLLVIAADTEGTVTKSIVHVEYGGFICGDGGLDFGEECDDGNNVDGDGCSSDCLIE